MQMHRPAVLLTTYMALQAQDRCHRIGQTREVHIYRLVCEATIEENILLKSDQKRALDHLAIQSGGFNTEYLSKFNPRAMFTGLMSEGAKHGACTLLLASGRHAGCGRGCEWVKNCLTFWAPLSRISTEAYIHT